jgi:FkbM family methyltransferase
MQSVAWKMLPYACLEARTPGGLRVAVADKGQWGCLDEIFIGRVYEPFWPALREVRAWVDLGCNAGFFSLALQDFLNRDGTGNQKITKAFLGDASEACVAQARESIQRNGLAGQWACEHVVIGPPGETVSFSQFKFSVHSNIFGAQRGERTFRYLATDFPALMSRLSEVNDLIKIDIEGAELFLFRHHADLMKRFRYGLCEWHAPQFDGAAMRDWLAGIGFQTLEMRSQSAGHDVARGHSWDSPMGMVLWRNPERSG